MKGPWIRRVRAFGGLIAIIALVSMVVLDFIDPRYVLTDRLLMIMTTLITGLLGVDVLLRNRDAIIAAILAGIEAYFKNKNGSNASHDRDSN